MVKISEWHRLPQIINVVYTIQIKVKADIWNFVCFKKRGRHICGGTTSKNECGHKNLHVLRHSGEFKKYFRAGNFQAVPRLLNQ
ncbi:MAG: hypothetical protein RSC73_04480 [Ruthenibacterium sp.]